MQLAENNSRNDTSLPKQERGKSKRPTKEERKSAENGEKEVSDKENIKLVQNTSEGDVTAAKQKHSKRQRSVQREMESTAKRRLPLIGIFPLIEIISLMFRILGEKLQHPKKTKHPV